MTVRRNQRRRRLMNEEYVSTFVETDQNGAQEGASASKTDSTKRAYAIGADRGSQLKTTDLFPKQLWVIALCGVVLFGIVASLNVLNVYAPHWRPFIGEASVRAISLDGPGTLSSWMVSVMLLLTGLASLQIFALRKHRCDDYGGTYRVWLIVPPIFFIASVATIVDFGAIFFHLASVAQLPTVANESLIPMTVKLSLVALIMIRLLFEIRDSKAAFSMLVVAWLAVAVSTVLNTQWAENRIAANELAMAYPNAVLVATISLMLAHLLYVRFVYLHAHGAIAIKKQAPAVAKTKTKARAEAKTKAKAKAKTKTPPKTTTAKTEPTKTTQKDVAPAKTKKPVREKAAPVAATKTNRKPAAPTKTATQKPATAVTPEKAKPAASSGKQKSKTMSDFQSLLKQKQAEQKTAQAAADATDAAAGETSSEGEILKMSKSERRRARKAAKAKRRAA